MYQLNNYLRCVTSQKKGELLSEFAGSQVAIVVVLY